MTAKAPFFKNLGTAIANDNDRDNPMSTAILKLTIMALLHAKNGHLRFTAPSGTVYELGTPGAHPAGEITVHDIRMMSKTIQHGDVGLTDAYIEGMWDSQDLAQTLQFFLENRKGVEHMVKGLSVPQKDLKQHQDNANTLEGSQRNIEDHYDLGNDFYSLWLDPSMTYTAALYETGDETLEEAQFKKRSRVIEQLGLKPEHSFLDIGGGWGALAIQASQQTGCRSTVITLSKEQAAFARAAADKAGVGDKVDIQIRDYRKLTEQFDRVASIEMIEAVGPENLPTYFEAVSKATKKGGRFLLQAIRAPDKNYDRYTRRVDFIKKHIFPGGSLVCDRVVKQLSAKSGFKLTDSFDMAASYARTLHEWNILFQNNWDKIQTLAPANGHEAFDPRFKRTWEMYLAYCEAAFASKALDVTQYTFDKT
jgi:cyclopropane-fatty-acyl-phospholipid synthase